MKIVLAINAGSSSVKISAFSVEARGVSPRQLCEAQVTGLTAPPAQLSYSRGDVTVLKDETVDEVKSHDDAFARILQTLIDDEHLTLIKSKADIAIACHRIVHGGDYTSSKVINRETFHHLEELSDLAPLHNGTALQIVRTCVEQLPDAVNVACFDSQFHATIPEHIYTYPIDPVIAKKNRLRKYGFHGISYSFITRSAAALLGKPQKDVNLIALHLGSGASGCAIKNGRSWDTTMGLTPLAGLPGATRSGSVDPSLVFHYASDAGKLSPSSTRDLHISRAEEILNKECGWKALTGTTNFGAIAAPSAGPSHRLAYDIFVDRVCAAVGAYYVSLAGRVDALVFAGGIGERSARLRADVAARAACLGFEIDDEANARGAGAEVVARVGKSGARHEILVCVTDEQAEMATACAQDAELW